MDDSAQSSAIGAPRKNGRRACVHAALETAPGGESVSRAITPDWAPRLYEYIGGIVRPHGAVLLAAGGIPDHVHLSVSLGKELSVSAALRIIKANSSKWVHDTFSEKRRFAWQNGYGAFSVSQSNLDDVHGCIAGQAEHHRTQTFQEEFIAFLERHQVPYDERYIWD